MVRRRLVLPLILPIVLLADPTSKQGSVANKHVDVERGLGVARIFGCPPWELVDH